MLFTFFCIILTAIASGTSHSGKQVSSGSDSGSPIYEVQPVHSNSPDGASSAHQGHDSQLQGDVVPDPLWYPNQATPEGFRRWAAIPPGHHPVAPGLFPICPLMPHGPAPHDHTCIVIRNSITAYRTGGRNSRPVNFNEWWQSSAGGERSRGAPSRASTSRWNVGTRRTMVHGFGAPESEGHGAMLHIGQLHLSWEPNLPNFVVASIYLDINPLLASWARVRNSRLLALNIGWRLDYRLNRFREWNMIMPLGSTEYPHGFPDPAHVPIDPRTGHPTVLRFGRYTWFVNEHDPENSEPPQQILLHYDVESLRRVALRSRLTNQPTARASPYFVFYMTAWEEPIMPQLEHNVMGQVQHGRRPPRSSGGGSSSG